jgi:3-deoxy-D-manno-octulosonic-acid transferase
LIIFFLSIFNHKIRNGFIGRFQTVEKLNKHFNKVRSNSLIYWFHCSSYGEYLQIEPVIAGIKKKKINSIILLSFFSPSGYDNAHNQNVDCKVYMPFDFYWTISSILDLVRPNKIIFATSDLWYNFILVAKRKNIDTVLIGAKSKKYFDKKLSFLHYVYKPIYRSITKIFTINKNDAFVLNRYIGDSNSQTVYQMGNPRYDQVIANAKKILDDNKKPILERENILLFASMHSDDRNVVLSHAMRYMEKNKNLQIVWVSHEPTDQENKYLESMFTRRDISVSVIDSIENFSNNESRVKIINIVGALAKLYWKVKVAYIGGGFSTGVHNLMEPSVAGLPTIFGPNYNEFDEALEILNNKSGFCIEKGAEFIEILDQLLNNDQRLLLTSTASKDLIDNNSGVSNKVVEAILSH